MSAAVVDTRGHIERALARLEAVATQVLTGGGDSVIRVSGWWGVVGWLQAAPTAALQVANALWQGVVGAMSVGE